MTFFAFFSRAIFIQLGAPLAPTWAQKPSQNGAKLAPKSHPTSNQATFAKSARRLSENHIFKGSGGSWESHFCLKICVWMQPLIQVGFQASSVPLWCQKLPKLGPNLGPNMGGTN